MVLYKPHTTSGTYHLTLVGVSINNDSYETVTSVTYNGTSLTYVGSETQNDDARVELWKLVAPPTGTHNVVITFSADLLRYAAAGMITFTGVNQATPLGSFAGNNATSNAASVSVPSASGDLILGVLGCETCTSVSFTTPAVLRWNVSAGSGNEIGAGATKAGANLQTTTSASSGKMRPSGAVRQDGQGAANRAMSLYCIITPTCPRQACGAVAQPGAFKRR